MLFTRLLQAIQESLSTQFAPTVCRSVSLITQKTSTGLGPRSGLKPISFKSFHKESKTLLKAQYSSIVLLSKDLHLQPWKMSQTLHLLTCF